MALMSAPVSQSPFIGVPFTVSFDVGLFSLRKEPMPQQNKVKTFQTFFHRGRELVSFATPSSFPNRLFHIVGSYSLDCHNREVAGVADSYTVPPDT